MGVSGWSGEIEIKASPIPAELVLGLSLAKVHMIHTILESISIRSDSYNFRISIFVMALADTPTTRAKHFFKNDL